MENKNLLVDETLNTVTGGKLTDADKEWVDDMLWYCVENEFSWSDVVERRFRDIEPYCAKVNAGRAPYERVTPREIEDYMKESFFVIGDMYNRGARRSNGKRVRRRRR